MIVLQINRKGMIPMFSSLSELWVAIILLAAVVIATGRWVIAKSTGKELVPGDSDILGTLRSKIVAGIATNTYLIELEKKEGRQAVRDEIEVQINEYIESATALTATEKDLLISLDKTQLLDYIEKELVRLKILAAE
jgi:hypothetical protein